MSNKKLRFPYITQVMLREAVDNGLVSSRSRETMIRNPNQFTVFHITFDCDSPRTSDAMLHMELEPEDILFKEFYEMNDDKKDPLENIVNYLLYMSKKYKVLSELLRRRNQLKHFDKQVAKQMNSKNIADHSLMVTEMPEHQDQQEVHFQLQVSVETPDRKKIFDKKMLKEKASVSKKIEMETSLLDKQMDYYSTAPELYQKASKNKNQQLEAIKKKLKRRINKVEEVCQKRRDDQERLYQQHEEKIQNIEKKLEGGQKRRQIKLMNSMDQTEYQKMKEMKQQRRLMIQQQSAYNEQSLIHSVVSQLKSKSELLQDNMQKKQQDDRQKYLQNLKLFEEKQHRLHIEYQQRQEQKIQDYISKSEQRQQQLLKHEQQKIKLVKSISLKNSKISKITSIYQSQQLKRHESIPELVANQSDKLEVALKRRQSLIEQKKSVINNKLEIRLSLAKQNKKQLLENKEQQAHKVLQRSMEISRKYDDLKKTQEELQRYKQEVCQEQIKYKIDLQQKLMK